MTRILIERGSDLIRRICADFLKNLWNVLEILEIQMKIGITPLVNVFFNLIGALIGIDFLWGGYWYTKTRDIKRTIGLSYLGLKLFERANRTNKSSNQFTNKMVSIMFSLEAVGIYWVVSGIGLVVRCLFPLLTQLIR
jgi:hypothetical protein